MPEIMPGLFGLSFTISWFRHGESARSNIKTFVAEPLTHCGAASGRPFSVAVAVLRRILVRDESITIAVIDPKTVQAAGNFGQNLCRCTAE